MKDLIIVKKWLAQAKASDLREQSNGYGAEFTGLSTIEGKDDEYGFIGEIECETEKAVALKTEITDAMGNDRTWTVWFPKSQIVNQLKTEVED